MKLRRYGIVTAAVLAALTLGSGVTSYAANAADGAAKVATPVAAKVADNGTAAKVGSSTASATKEADES